MCFSQEYQSNKIQFYLQPQSLSYPLTILIHDYHDAAQVFTASSYVFVKFQLDSHERKQTQHLLNLVPQLYKVQIYNAHSYFMQLLSD